MSTRRAADAASEPAPDAEACAVESNWLPHLAPADDAGRVALVFAYGGQVRRADPTEVEALVTGDDPEARLATVRDLAIAGVA